MLRHVVIMRVRPGTTDEQCSAALDELRSLAGVVPSLRHLEAARDARVVEGNGDLVIVADFDDADGYLAYAHHPAHLKVIAERTAPIALERLAVQYERPDAR